MEFIAKLINPGTTAVVFLSAFLICFIGYAIGSIKVKGLCLGTAGVFLFALLFGYLCTLPGLSEIPLLSKFFMADASDAKIDIFGFLGDMGLVLFVTAVGCIAGPKFFRNLKKNAKSYVPMGALIILMGALVTVVFALIPGIGAAYATGILSGALTSTPAFSASKAAVEAMAADQVGMVSLGHAVAYPFGVVGVVLFVQIMPRLLKANMAKERELIGAGEASAKPVDTEETAKTKGKKKLIELDEFGFGAFGLAIVLGLILGSIKIPLSSAGFSGSCFSLGMTGGPLIMSLILGHFGRFGRISLKVETGALKAFREFGLMLFLIGAGVEGGVELVEQVSNSQYGAMIIVYGFLAGVVMTLIPMIVGYFFAKKVCKLALLNNLGSITGGMTSTPALGTLVGVAGTDDVAAAYASTYPVALVLVVLASQLINSFML